MRIICFCLLSLLAMSAFAQDKLDFAGRNVADSLNQTYNVIVVFDGKNIDFGNCKVDIVSQLGNMAVVNVTAAGMKEIAALPNVKSVTLGNGARLLDGGVDGATTEKADSVSAVTKDSPGGLRGFFRRLFRRLGWSHGPDDKSDRSGLSD